MKLEYCAALVKESFRQLVRLRRSVNATQADARKRDGRAEVDDSDNENENKK